MDPIIEALVNDVKALQWPIYANLAVSFLALTVVVLVRTTLNRGEERLKSSLQLELEVRRKMNDAREQLISTEQNLFHSVMKVANENVKVKERDDLAMEFRRMARDYKGRFSGSRYQRVYRPVLDLVHQLTDEIFRLRPQQPLLDNYITCRDKLHQALDELSELIWSGKLAA